MRELIVIDERVVFEKKFRVYGDFENPLFLARDVAEWIEYDKEKVGQMLNTIDNDEKMTSPIYYSGQVRNMWFVTEDGLYEVLMQSRKPIAKQWKKKVKEILKEIRKTGTYTRPLTPAEQLLAQAQLMVDMENRLNILEKNNARLENNLRRTITSDYFTVIGYANFRGINADTYNSSVIGRKASKLCKDCGLAIGKVIDSKYGTINTYPLDILDEIFALIN
ncbi:MULTISPECIES: BRO-N domain-containing protein [Fusobacterium]|jgi:possible bacteriophage antirepressor|uniref:BRO-N domain-containing protein n=1 Tax=Fusobacterium TaxID=848 RepID=UPI00201A2C48|nr:BRO family protein [Fusobacterium nucleatum]MCL4584193.1 antirepressor [Fusobacterium nucleatum YWH7055]DAR23581.1 MAG TPA: antirepressor [Caudoviricetes sp.]